MAGTSAAPYFLHTSPNLKRIRNLEYFRVTLELTAGLQYIRPALCFLISHVANIKMHQSAKSRNLRKKGLTPSIPMQAL